MVKAAEGSTSNVISIAEAPKNILLTITGIAEIRDHCFGNAYALFNSDSHRSSCTVFSVFKHHLIVDVHHNLVAVLVEFHHRVSK